jgi:hypothetical protein
LRTPITVQVSCQYGITWPRLAGNAFGFGGAFGEVDDVHMGLPVFLEFALDVGGWSKIQQFVQAAD